MTTIYELKHTDLQSAVFIDQQLLEQLLQRESQDRFDGTTERNFLDGLSALAKNHLLVLVNHMHEPSSPYTPPPVAMEPKFGTSGITFVTTLSLPLGENEGSDHAHVLKHPAVLHFAALHRIDLGQSFVIHASLQVEILKEHASDQPYKPELLETMTFFFHTATNAVQWILKHTTPWRTLHMALVAGSEAIRAGNLVVFPTETVYGLGADATNAQAVARIFSAKERPSNDPLIVHVCDEQQLHELVTVLPAKAKRLMQEFWPGPLTIVLPKSPKVPSIVTSGYSSVAVRMPSNPLALELIRLSGRPIAAPSANRFGRSSPTTAQHVREQLEGRFEVLIDGGACTVGIESTVISFVGDVPKILRPGKVDQESIEACIGPVESEKQALSADEKRNSPGLLENHYAPRTPMYIVEDMRCFASRKDVGFLLFEDENSHDFQGPVEYVSRNADMQEIAIRLYHAMRNLDELRLSMLVVKLLPEKSIGVAINNRLRKAATKTPFNITPEIDAQEC
jgi:L-threonylcarbamoyladenylate synthase